MKKICIKRKKIPTILLVPFIFSSSSSVATWCWELSSLLEVLCELLECDCSFFGECFFSSLSEWERCEREEFASSGSFKILLLTSSPLWLRSSGMTDAFLFEFSLADLCPSEFDWLLLGKLLALCVLVALLLTSGPLCADWELDVLC